MKTMLVLLISLSSFNAFSKDQVLVCYNGDYPARNCTRIYAVTPSICEEGGGLASPSEFDLSFEIPKVGQGNVKAFCGYDGDAKLSTLKLWSADKNPMLEIGADSASLLLVRIPKLSGQIRCELVDSATVAQMRNNECAP
jgi:hypothetical protein